MEYRKVLDMKTTSILNDIQYKDVKWGGGE